MSYTIKVDYPNLPQGEVVLIDGVGEVKNGVVVSITDEQADAFRNSRQRWDDKTGSYVQGPTLLEAFKSSQYVKVETAKADKKKEGDN